MLVYVCTRIVATLTSHFSQLKEVILYFVLGKSILNKLLDCVFSSLPDTFAPEQTGFSQRRTPPPHRSRRFPSERKLQTETKSCFFNTVALCSFLPLSSPLSLLFFPCFTLLCTCFYCCLCI